MAFVIVGERFSCEQVTEDHGSDAVAALNSARELSKYHDMDFVIVLQDGYPIVKYVDGNEG